MEKAVLLQILDSSWMEHLRAMDHLRSSIGLQGYAQIDPKVEYKREGMKIFAEMWTRHRRPRHRPDLPRRAVRPRIPRLPGLAVGKLDRAQTIHEQAESQLAAAPPASAASAQQQEPRSPAASSPPRRSASRSATLAKKVGRNDPCPCGSGKKFKACCMRKQAVGRPVLTRPPCRADSAGRRGDGPSLAGAAARRPYDRSVERLIIRCRHDLGAGSASPADRRRADRPRERSPTGPAMTALGDVGRGTPVAVECRRLFHGDNEAHHSGKGFPEMPFALNLIYCGRPAASSPRSCSTDGLRTGKYRDGWEEKLWGKAPLRIGDQPCLWFHAVSVGEVLLLRPLVQRDGPPPSRLGDRRSRPRPPPDWRSPAGRIPTS